MRTETIEYRDLDVAGYYDWERDVIVLNKRLRHGSMRSTLEHERVHRERGDKRCDNRWFDNKQERHVEQIAARRLITEPMLWDGLEWTQHPVELADLWVVDTQMAIVRLHLAKQDMAA